MALRRDEIKKNYFTFNGIYRLNIIESLFLSLTLKRNHIFNSSLLAKSSVVLFLFFFFFGFSFICCKNSTSNLFKHRHINNRHIDSKGMRGTNYRILDSVFGNVRQFSSCASDTKTYSINTKTLRISKYEYHQISISLYTYLHNINIILNTLGTRETKKTHTNIYRKILKHAI